jgi:glycosyltransferase involved in cell wall biosynthesis
MAYIQATSVGGTHPALIESMAAGNLVLAYSTPENREVTSGTALLFEDEAQLADALTRVTESPDSPAHQELRAAARDWAAQTYSWPAIADRYEALFRRLAGPTAAVRPRS